MQLKFFVFIKLIKHLIIIQVFSAEKIISQRNKLVEAYSIQWGQLMAESTKSVSITDSLRESASPPSHQKTESTLVASQQNIIHDLEAKVENGRIAEDKLKLLERQNTELKQQQQQLLEVCNRGWCLVVMW